VLFLDLLGVSEMSRDDNAERHLRKLGDAVGAYRNFLAADSPYPAAFFSDSFVLASPALDGEASEAAAVAEVVGQAAWLQLDLLERGFFARGAITLGPIHLRQGLVFGPALVEAHDLERDAAVYPRIILAREAEKSQRSAVAASEGSLGSLPLLYDNDSRAFVDYMRVLLEDPNSPVPVLEKYRQALSERLQEYREDRVVWEKYRWVGEYHNQRLAAEPGRIAALGVTADLITRRFAALS
jgi:hypothetical protein